MTTTAAAINSLGNYAVNPRGNLWYNDDSTLGHKLLAKMGWSKGKGLGKNEDGIKENIKVRGKSSNTGVGWKDKLYTDVISIGYDALLKSLNERNSENGTIPNNNNRQIRKSTSLVDLSRGFRNRLHYQKFVKQKDVSQYSEKDMKAIFLFSAKPSDAKSENHTEEKQARSASECEELNSSETFKSELSVSDYFAKKMKEKKDKLLNKVSSNKPDLQETVTIFDDSEMGNPSSMNDINGFSAKKKKKVKEITYMNNCNSITTDEREQSFAEPTVRKKKRKRPIEESVEEDTSLKNTTCENEIACEVSHKKKKKKRNSENLILCHKSDILCNRTAITCDSHELMENSEMQNYKSLSSDSVKITEAQSTNDDTNRQQLKKEKKKKKKSKFRDLKSCLKKRSGKYSVKNVSFSECVSYRIINRDNSILDFNSDGCIISPNKKEYNILDVQNDCNGISEATPVDEVKTGELEVKNEESGQIQMQAEESSQVQMQAEESSQVQMQAEESDGSAVSDLPKSSNFDPWAESQKQASRMKIYKNMLKALKKHDVLRTSNLLSIKGYGNWGF